MRGARALAVFALWLALPAAASALPLLPSGVSTKHNLQVRPYVVAFTGDSTGFLGGFNGTGRGDFGHMHWSRWTRRQAKGHGAVWVDNCVPDCAGGPFHPYAVTVYATRPEGNVFRRLTLHYRYQGKAVVDRRIVVHSGRLWYYTVTGL